MNHRTRIDHLVVAAASLHDGLAWCRETIGFEPAAGGAHPLMGTHNRVFRIDSPTFERAYFEVIAIDPAAEAPNRTRWFDLDDARMQSILKTGPRLIHFVAATSDVHAAVAALAAQGIDRGAPVAAERGSLRWQITVRPDGQRLFDGTLPTLIQWEGAHPVDSLPASGVSLLSLRALHPKADRLQRALGAIGLANAEVELAPDSSNLVATLSTPKGVVRLESGGA